MKIINLSQIKTILKNIDILPEIEKGFVAYSTGQAIIPAIGELHFQDPPGDVHIKYGYINSHDYYVVKIASSFYENVKFNLPSSNGIMLVYNRRTGELLAIFLDEGYLTDVRTAVAGAIAAKYLAPKIITRIGIIGTGTQAKLQLEYLDNIVECKEVMVWSRNPNNARTFKENVQGKFSVSIAKNVDEITQTCNLIITTTAAESPLLFAHQIKKGTHITAVGADTPYKQELDPHIFPKADIVVADSIIQCLERGDISHAVKNNTLNPDKIIELGNVILEPSKRRYSNDQITVADLTGVAVQDIQIAKTVFEHLIHPDFLN